MSLGPSEEGVKHSEGPQTLSFQHRFKSGALCKLTVDLASVKAGKFRPTLVWSGRPPSKKRELITWTLSVFATVANRAQASIRYSFWHEPGRSETWDCRPENGPDGLNGKRNPAGIWRLRSWQQQSARWRSRPRAMGGRRPSNDPARYRKGLCARFH